MAQSMPACRLINCARELDESGPQCHVQLGLRDSSEQRIDEAVATAADVVRRYDGPVLLFCKNGQVCMCCVFVCSVDCLWAYQSRSVAVAIGVLMLVERMSLKAA